jgi:hypothetical protein
MDFPIGSPALGFDSPLSQSGADADGWILVAFVLAVAIVAVAGLSTGVFAARRRFWCASAGRDVEVTTLETGLSGFRRPVAILGCSVFDRPTEVTCGRGCLDRDARVKLPLPSLFERRRS